MVSEKNTRVNIKLDKKTYEKAKKVAEKEKRSVSNLLNLFIERELKTNEKSN